MVAERARGLLAVTMNIIIVGAGEIGRHLAVSLSREAHSIVVIENDAQVAAELEQHIDGRVVTGSGASANALLEAGEDPEGPAFRKAEAWLLEREITETEGDWRVRRPNLAPGVS